MRTLRLFSFSLLLLALPLLALLLLHPAAVQAQSPCSHVLFRVDSTMELDQQAVCNAAEPWREQGIQLYVYLTDSVPTDEEAWFALLDQVEIEAGLRSPGAEGGFDLNGLAFEASARSGVPWTNTITFGEELFDTPLDDDAALEQVKAALFGGLQRGDATAAFSNAVTAAYEVTFPPPSRTGLALGGVALLAAGGGALFLFVGRPALQKRRREQMLEEHLGVVRQNVANLLLAAERLLDGERPQDTILYQLYAANGGTFDKPQTEEVVEWLRRSRAALADAFDLRRELLAGAADGRADLEDEVRKWEMIYVTLAGTTPRVLELTDAELQDLLNPLVVLEREAEDAPLAQQLDAIRREIAGMPLKVELLAVDPGSVDREGILGYIDLTEQAIKTLLDARRDAPGALQQAQETLAQTEEAAEEARPFGLTPAETMGAIATRLAEADQLLQAGNAVAALALINRAARDLEIVADLMAAQEDYRQDSADLEEITAAGYRPSQLAADQQEVETDIANIVAAVRAGDYLAADNWIDELDADSERALAFSQSWRERQQFNEESLRRVEQHLAGLATLEQQAQPAWQALQEYPASNWQDITPGLPALSKTLNTISAKKVPQIVSLNSLAVQEIPAAETLLAETGQAILQTERQLQALINRLDEVRAAENNLSEGLRQGQAELERVSAYRDREDRRTGPDVDSLIAEAAVQLEQTAALQAERAFMPAVDTLLSGREKAASALALAREQVAEIERLENALLASKQVAEGAVAAARRAAEAQPGNAHTGESSALLAAAEAALSDARQREAAILPYEDKALAAALAAVTQAYQVAAEEARQAQEQIERENERYAQLYRKTVAQVAAAAAAISRAERFVRDRDARGEGKEALQRAMRTLPDDDVPRDSSIEMLASLLENGRLAEEYAKEAERKARVAISYRTPQPDLPFPGPAGPFGRIPGGSVIIGGRPRTSNRAMQRRAAPAPSMSRRSSSFGGASRSSSMGSSRRSSGGASRRR